YSFRPAPDGQRPLSPAADLCKVGQALLKGPISALPMNDSSRSKPDSIAGRYARDLEPFDNAAAALRRITEIYDSSVAAIRSGFKAAARGGQAERVDANYPYIAVAISRSNLHVDARLSWGVLLEAGTYGTTLTRPALFTRYSEEQIGYILKHPEVPVHVGVSSRPIPLPFVIEESVTDITEADLRALQA